MTANMVGFQLSFGRKTHRKARWKRARKRWLIRNNEEQLIPWSNGKTRKSLIVLGDLHGYKENTQRSGNLY